MKTNVSQLEINFAKVEKNFSKVPVTERARDSEGQYVSEVGDIDDSIDVVEKMKRENELINRRYLAVAKLLATAERELLKLKQV